MKIPLLSSFFLVMAACTADTEPVVDSMAVDQAPPPYLVLEMPDSVIAGITFTLTAYGSLGEGETVYFGRSYSGIGSGPCPRAAGGLCLDIQAPAQLAGTAVVDADGYAYLDVTLPPGRAGSAVYFQAVSIRGVRGSASIKSDVASDTMLSAIYGCTDPTAINYDPSATIDDGTCTADSGGAGRFDKFTWAEAGVANNGRGNAEAYCASLGGTLARPDNQADWDAIYNSLTVDSLGWWIDGHNNFICGSAFPGSPKTYEYGEMYAPSGTSNLYTGCNCHPSETGLVVYRYDGNGHFDGCQGVSTNYGNLGAMDEGTTYNHPNIVGFICELPGVAPIVEMVGGDIPYQTSCVAGDYECQAEQVCEGVTGTDCVRQDYECAYGYMGSYYPVGTPGSSTFNFAVAYDFQFGDYGNICCGDPNYCMTYGIRMDHTGAGYGHWFRVASVPGCTDPAANNYDPAATEDDGSCTYTSSQACTIKQSEHPTYTTPDQRVALCGNTYSSGNIDSACAAGWQVCTYSQWQARYPAATYPGGTLTSFGDLQSSRMTGGIWNAMAPTGTSTWDCGTGCYDGYNPWNNGKYLRTDDRSGIMKGSGGCCGWDSTFTTTAETSSFAVYCCQN